MAMEKHGPRFGRRSMAHSVIRDSVRRMSAAGILGFGGVRWNDGGDGGGGNQTGDWTANFEQGQKDIVALKGWKTPSDMLKGYTELERMVGLEKIPLPVKDKDGNFTQDGVLGVMDRIGRPKDPSGYKLSPTFKFPEGVTVSNEAMAEFAKYAHQHGYTNGMYEASLAYFGQMIEKGKVTKDQESQKAYQDAENTLRKEFGLTYDAKKELANRVLKKYGNKDAASVQILMDKYANDPVIIGLLARVGGDLSEEKLTPDGLSGETLTPLQAEQKMREITSDPKHPYFVATHPDHNYWVKKMEEYTKMSMAGK